MRRECVVLGKDPVHSYGGLAHLQRRRKQSRCSVRSLISCRRFGPVSLGLMTRCLHDALLEDDRKTKCSDCEFSYHLGECSGIAETTFKSKGYSWHKQWRWQTCRSSSKRGGQSSKHKMDSDLDPSLVMITFTTMNKKIGHSARC